MASLSVFNNDCCWPRRLLHLETLTSYSWEPGNQYGGHTEPEYFAISYTWGRWELSNGEHPEIGNLDFHTPWKIPRIDPSRFTQKQFINVIQKLPKLCDKPIHFLWVDIACIDQREYSREKAMEIGRQGIIFRGAYRVFAWLHKYDKSELQLMSEKLASDWRCVWNPIWKNNRSTEDVAGLVGNIISTLDKYTADPWFTSVWTLQEAYLRSDALLLDRNGDQWIAKRNSVSPVFDETEIVISLDNLFESFDMVYRALNELPIFYHIPGLQGLRDRIEETGCIGLKTGIPTMLLSASRNRKVGPKNANDRVYGIMQIFNLKLGVSAPGSPPSAVYDLETLEDQLGAKLMENSPVMSQLFTHSKPAPAGKGWRMGYHSKIPHLATMAKSFLQVSSFETTTTFSVTEAGGIMVGQFSGPTCPIHRLARPWKEHEVLGGDSVGIELDNVSGVDPPPDLLKFIHLKRDLNLVDWFTKEGLNVVILLLGSCITIPRNQSEQLPKRVVNAVGLLLLHSEEASYLMNWRRLGICWWNFISDDYMERVGEGASSVATLAGKGDDWVYKRGTFG